jgi:hypothetical protein
MDVFFLPGPLLNFGARTGPASPNGLGSLYARTNASTPLR